MVRWCSSSYTIGSDHLWMMTTRNESVFSVYSCASKIVDIAYWILILLLSGIDKAIGHSLVNLLLWHFARVQ